MTATSRPLESPMLRYKLRTLMIVLAVAPPVLAWGWKGYTAYARSQEIAALQAAIEKYRFGSNERISYVGEGGRPDEPQPLSQP